MTKLKLILCCLLTAVLALALAACGETGSAGSDSFTVDYVGTYTIGGDFLISGEYKGDTCVLSAGSAFKDCKFEGYAFASDGEVNLTATGDGVLVVDDGVVLTLRDADGAGHEVTVQQGSVFQAEAEGDSIKLLLPAD